MYGACFKVTGEANPHSPGYNPNLKHIHGWNMRVTDCRQHCRDLGADIALPINRDVDYFVGDFLRNRSLGLAWLGVTIDRVVGNYTSIVDGSPLKYTRWQHDAWRVDYSYPRSIDPRWAMEYPFSPSFRPDGCKAACVIFDAIGGANWLNPPNRGWRDVENCDATYNCLCQVSVGSKRQPIHALAHGFAPWPATHLPQTGSKRDKGWRLDLLSAAAAAAAISVVIIAAAAALPCHHTRPGACYREHCAHTGRDRNSCIHARRQLVGVRRCCFRFIQCHQSYANQRADCQQN